MLYRAGDENLFDLTRALSNEIGARDPQIRRIESLAKREQWEQAYNLLQELESTRILPEDAYDLISQVRERYRLFEAEMEQDWENAFQIANGLLSRDPSDERLLMQIKRIRREHDINIIVQDMYRAKNEREWNEVAEAAAHIEREYPDHYHGNNAIIELHRHARGWLIYKQAEEHCLSEQWAQAGSLLSDSALELMEPPVAAAAETLRQRAHGWLRLEQARGLGEHGRWSDVELVLSDLQAPDTDERLRQAVDVLRRKLQHEQLIEQLQTWADRATQSRDWSRAILCYGRLIHLLEQDSRRTGAITQFRQVRDERELELLARDAQTAGVQQRWSEVITILDQLEKRRSHYELPGMNLEQLRWQAQTYQRYHAAVEISKRGNWAEVVLNL